MVIEDNLSKVIKFINAKIETKKIINNKTTLSDLGLDGDDTLEFLLSFFEEFKVEYKNTNYLVYIPQESGFLRHTFRSLYLKKKENINEIFIQDLVNSLELGKWYKVKP